MSFVYRILNQVNTRFSTHSKFKISAAIIQN